MTEIKKEYKRNINPDNKPGPDPIFGERLNRTLIVKLNDELIEKLDKHAKDNSKNKSEVVRDFIEKL